MDYFSISTSMILKSLGTSNSTATLLNIVAKHNRKAAVDRNIKLKSSQTVDLSQELINDSSLYGDRVFWMPQPIHSFIAVENLQYSDRLNKSEYYLSNFSTKMY